ncbi:MAG: hypothetical protein IBX60_01780 [Candidatus Aminicenantes bacterium]|nr:hypothetical protein [Candidatus Aminicenantes bacterium]
MRKISAILGVIFMAFFLLQAYAQKVEPDEKLFQEAKILLFDKKWDAAKEKLDELLEEFPNSPLYPQAIFYRAKCLEGQEGKELVALENYQRYIRLRKRNQSLTEEAEISIIDLSFKLYEKGKRSFLKEIEKRLSHSNKVIRYYAAFKLSYAKDKKIAEAGIPILKEIVRKETDDELRDRAKIAILRVNPNALKDFEEERYEKRARILKIRVYKNGKQQVSINIPWALADLALSAIEEKDRAVLKKKGYDLDRIINELKEFKGNIIEIEDEGTVIKIWID